MKAWAMRQNIDQDRTIINLRDGAPLIGDTESIGERCVNTGTV